MNEHELSEVAEKAHAPFEKQVGATMAIIAAALALVSVYGHIFTTEELLMQTKASDQWSYYQSKSIRRYQSESSADVLAAMGTAASGAAAKKYEANAARYRGESEKIQEQARELEHESETCGKRALRLHAGEIFLEIAIVLSSLALLTHKRSFWLMGILSSLVGATISATVFLIH